MTIEEIRELIQLVLSTGVAELEVQRGDNRVRIKRAPNGVTQEYVATVAPSTSASAAHPPAVPHTVSPSAPSSNEPDLTDPSLTAVKSPIVGTFYESSSPGAEAFVKAGDSIKPGQVLCIIESMKLMNEIEAEVSGTIVKRLVENGQPVEYGEALFLVKPN